MQFCNRHVGRPSFRARLLTSRACMCWLQKGIDREAQLLLVQSSLAQKQAVLQLLQALPVHSNHIKCDHGPFSAGQSLDL